MRLAAFAPLPPRNLEKLLFHMPTVARTVGSARDKGFALSIMRQAHKRDWRPTDKQLALMRKLVSELFTVDPRDDVELSLIEG